MWKKLSVSPKTVIASGLIAVGCVTVKSQTQDARLPAIDTVLEQQFSSPCDDGPCVLGLIDHGPVSDAFQDLLLIAELPGGIVELSDRKEKPSYELKPASLKFVDLLNSLSFAESRYRWAQVDGVLNFTPVQVPLLLEARISDFRGENATVLELLLALKHNPDFESALQRLGFVEPKPFNNEFGFHFGGFAGKPLTPSRKITMRMENSTVRQILNEIVRREGCGIWDYRQFGCEDGTSWFHLNIDYYCG